MRISRNLNFKLFLSILIIITLSINQITSKTKEEWKSRVIYQLLTDRFARTNGDTSGCDLHNYCGGSFRGIINNLDYISGMGFNAIWISPVVENTPGSYHGYHMTNLYTINSNFGSEQDLRDLISACHARDIWIMLDVVANHVGPVGTDYNRVHPFHDAEHYHDVCQINSEDFAKNQARVEVKLNLQFNMHKLIFKLKFIFRTADLLIYQI
jgi:alpha-amylase